MTQDEIIEMARHIATTLGSRMCDENGHTHGEELYVMGIDEIVEAIELIAAKEREACAKTVEAEAHMFATIAAAKSLADGIRTRGEE